MFVVVLERERHLQFRREGFVVEKRGRKFWILMAGFATKWLMLMILCSFMLASAFVSGERSIKHEASTFNVTKEAGFNSNYLSKVVNFLWQSDRSGYQHVWPVNWIFTSIPTMRTVWLDSYKSCLFIYPKTWLSLVLYYHKWDAWNRYWWGSSQNPQSRNMILLAISIIIFLIYYIPGFILQLAWNCQ